MLYRHRLFLPSQHEAGALDVRQGFGKSSGPDTHRDRRVYDARRRPDVSEDHRKERLDRRTTSLPVLPPGNRLAGTRHLRLVQKPGTYGTKPQRRRFPRKGVHRPGDVLAGLFALLHRWPQSAPTTLLERGQRFRQSQVCPRPHDELDGVACCPDRQLLFRAAEASRVVRFLHRLHVEYLLVVEGKQPSVDDCCCLLCICVFLLTNYYTIERPRAELPASSLMSTEKGHAGIASGLLRAQEKKVQNRVMNWQPPHSSKTKTKK